MEFKNELIKAIGPTMSPIVVGWAGFRPFWRAFSFCNTAALPSAWRI